MNGLRHAGHGMTASLAELSAAEPKPAAPSIPIRCARDGLTGMRKRQRQRRLLLAYAEVRTRKVPSMRMTALPNNGPTSKMSHAMLDGLAALGGA